jgi:Peptidase family S58
MSSLGLLDLANQHFYDLTDHERNFLKSVRAGKEDRIESSQNASAPAKRRILRCGIIRWLCTNEEAKKLVDPFGIQIDSAEITALPNSDKECIHNFSSLILPFPLVFKNCVLPSKVLMLGMESTFLSFENSRVGSIEADVLRIKGGLSVGGILVHVANRIVSRSKHAGRDNLDAIFAATVQAVEESIINAMIVAETMTGIENHKVMALQHDQLRAARKKYNRLTDQ